MTSFLRNATAIGSKQHWLPLLLICGGTVAVAAALGFLSSIFWLGILLLALALIILLRRPELGLIFLLLAAFLVPLEVGASTDVSVNAVVLLLPLLFALWLFRALRQRQHQPVGSRVFLPLFLFVLMVSISWLLGNARWDPLFPRSSNLLLVQAGQWALYVFSVLAFVLTAQQSLPTLKWLTYAFIVFGALAMVVRYGGAYGKIIAVFLRTNAAGNATFFVWLAALAGGQALFNKQLDRRWRLVLALVALAVPILGFFQNTAWASSWMPSLIVVAILLLLRSRFGGSALLLLAFALMLVFSSFLLQYFDWDLEREYSIASRYVLWRSVFALAVKQPIFGLGLTTYHQYHRFIPLLTEHGRWLEPSVNSHNVYLDLFAQVGLVGLALFSWAMVEIGLLGWHLRARFTDDFGAGYAASALAGLVGVLFASGIVEWMLPFAYNVGFRGFRFSVFTWIFLGGLVVLENLQSSEQRNLAKQDDRANDRQVNSVPSNSR